ncbi:hypothetical protein JVX92_00735 [Microbacterium hominis]|uniref:terminase large subunit domain-containing protein n=1 Tax=Microbacterium hominis TaxID=162426 RepID=UPI0019645F24|nr:terminase large subunit [Microbacterium hominis]QRY40854.1 hypothetical protein JVX92_00735 [Microbacterium hominis]
MTSSPAIRSWPPARYSEPLSPDFPSDGDWLIKLVELTWRNDDGSPMVLDRWQKLLIRHVLEIYPEGHPRAGDLRYREAFVSVARQNGKSVIGAILAMYGLLREKGALVIGLASTADQARIVYKRLLKLIHDDPRLSRRFKKATDTRGIHAANGSVYEIKASKSNAVQGLATSLGIIDELHITAPALWADLVNGIAAKPRGLVFGITTAGDEESELLLALYKRAEAADDERFGYFIWQAEADTVPDDDETLGRYICQASPSIAEGRRPLDEEIRAARGQAPADVVHFKLNRFVASLNPYMPADRWALCARPEAYEFPVEGPLVFTFDMTPEDGYATCTATRKTPDGTIHTELVAWWVNPTTEALIRVAEQLWQHYPTTFAGDGYKLRPMLLELKKRGYPVHIGTQTDAVNSAGFLFSRVMQRTLVHGNEPLLQLQIPRTVRKNKGDVYVIDRTSSSVEMDAVRATALGAYIAEQQQPIRGLGIV